MVKKILAGIVVLLVAGLLFVVVGLVRAHAGIRRERAPLPAPAALQVAAEEDRPVRLTWINTASQPMPRSAVLDPHLDPHPSLPYVMSHPAFVLEWADGRLLLIDTGMNRAQALAFGRRLEWLAGAAAIQAHGSVAEQLGPQRAHVAGIVFTHLHTDHTGGLVGLCAGRDGPLPVFATEAQAERPNYTTRPGREQIAHSGCARIAPLRGGPAFAVEGFPGVRVVAVGGHTPGSQLVVADVRAAEGGHRYVFTGDIANHIDGIEENIPKPFLYSMLVVPEDGLRLFELRGYLRDLSDTGGAVLLISHDQAQIEHTGIAAWAATGS